VSACHARRSGRCPPGRVQPPRTTPAPLRDGGSFTLIPRFRAPRPPGLRLPGTAELPRKSGVHTIENNSLPSFSQAEWLTLAAPAGWLEYAAAPRYGLQISKQADLETGTLYPVMARLDRVGWVESSSEDPDLSISDGRHGGVTTSWPRTAPSRHAWPWRKSPAGTRNAGRASAARSRARWGPRYEQPTANPPAIGRLQ